MKAIPTTDRSVTAQIKISEFVDGHMVNEVQLAQRGGGDYLALAERVLKALNADDPQATVSISTTTAKVSRAEPSDEDTPQPLLVPAWPEGARSIGIGKTKMFELIRIGYIKSVVIGRKRLVHVDELRSFAERGTT